MINEELVAVITKEAAGIFPSFGGGNVIEFNPIAEALKDAPAMFAAGVDISAVVRLTLKMAGHDALLEACKDAKEAVYAAINGNKSKLSHVWHNLEQVIAEAEET